MKRALPTALAFAFVLIPAFALAQTNDTSSFNLINVRNSIANISAFINQVLIPAIFTLAFLFFVWGVFKAFILKGHDEESREQGKKFILWSVLGLVAMLCVWGVVNLIASSLGWQGDRLDQNAIPVFGPGGSTGN